MLLSLHSLSFAAGVIGSLSRLLCLNPASHLTEKKRQNQLVPFKQHHWVSQVALVGKNPPANAEEMWVWSLGHEARLEEGMATDSSTLTCENLMGRGAWRAKVHRVLRVGCDRSDLAFTQAAQHSA